jgi:plastocyanin
VNWIALVVAAGLAAATARHHHHAPTHHTVPVAQRQAKKAPAHTGALRPRAAPPVTPGATPAPPGTPLPNPGPTATATATPTATATATPVPLYSAAGVDVQDTPEYTLVPTHTQFRAGGVTFNGQNFGMDDHNLTVRDSGGHVVGSEPLPADTGLDSHALTVSLTPGTYTLYCSLPGHEAAGMRFDVTVRSG